MIRILYGIDLGNVGFFLEQVDDLGVEDLFLHLVDAAVFLELIGHFLRLDFLLHGHGSDLAAEFLLGHLDALFLGDLREDVVGLHAELGVCLGIGVNVVRVLLAGRRGDTAGVVGPGSF